jgi:hypothetical protein
MATGGQALFSAGNRCHNNSTYHLPPNPDFQGRHLLEIMKKKSTL